jgi:hypothetical protein
VQGLWELQVFAQADGVLRDGKVAFAVAADRALQWPGGTGPGQPPGGTAAAGGRRRPLRGARHAVCHRPRWPAEAGRAGACSGVVRWPGAGQLVLPFDQAALPAGFGAPYELRDLQLQDQSRMAPIESRALALRF